MTRTEASGLPVWAVSALLRLRARIAPLGRRMYAVVPPNGVIRKVFDVAGVAHLIPVRDDVGSAIARAVTDTVYDGEAPAPG
jgi:hypothetical protein